MDNYWYSVDLNANEKEYFNETKSEEEINRYTLKEDLSTLQRTKEILSYGDIVQKAAIYKNLPFLIQESGIEERLMSMVAKQLESIESQVQVEAGISFLKMITEKKTDNFKQTEFLKDILQLTMNMLHNENIQVIDIWIEVFQKLLSEIPFQEISKSVVSEIYDLSGICSSSISKYSSMRMIASSIQYIGKNINDNLLNLIKLFNQVNDFQIKKSIVSEIWPKLFPLLKPSQLDSEWIPLVTDIIKNQNENKDIRCYAIATLAETIQNFSPDIKSDKIIPILSFLISYNVEIDIVIEISKQFGPLIYHLEKEINSKGISQQVINYIYDSMEHTNEQVRSNTFFNYPCFLQLFGEKQKCRMIKQYTNSLTKDSEIKVRLQTVKVLPEVIKYLGLEETKIQLKQHIKSIIIEKEQNEIRIELAKKLPQILIFLQQTEKQQSQTPTARQLSITSNSKGIGGQLTQEILTEILNCIDQNTKLPCWRLIKQLLEIFQETQHIFDFSEISDKYSNLLLKCILESNFEVKKIAAHNLVQLIAQSKIPLSREYLFSQINTKLYSGRSYHLRLIYLEIIDECILKFSRQFFKQYNLIQALQLYSDKVPNVRRKLASLIIKIRNCIFKEDKEQIENFDCQIIHLLSDHDSETAKIAQQQHSNLKEIDSFQSSSDALDKIIDFQDSLENEDDATPNKQKQNMNFNIYNLNVRKQDKQFKLKNNLFTLTIIIKESNILKNFQINNTFSRQIQSERKIIIQFIQGLKLLKNVQLFLMNNKFYLNQKVRINQQLKFQRIKRQYFYQFNLLIIKLEFRSYEQVDKGSPLTPSVHSAILPGIALIKKKSINIKKIPALLHANSQGTPKNSSVVITNNKPNQKNGTINISQKYPTGQTIKVRRYSSNSSNTNSNDKPPSNQSLIIQKPLSSLTQNFGQLSSGSLQKPNNHLMPLQTSQAPQIYSNTDTLKIVIQQEQNSQRSYQRKNTFNDQSEIASDSKERNCQSLNKYNILKPLQITKNQFKIDSFNRDLTPKQSISNPSNINMQNDKKYNIDRKGTFENNPNVLSETRNLYRIKKQVPLQSQGLPPKIQLKRKS